jgi:hypothetical protein
VCCFPEQIFPNLGKFQCLKELSVKLDDKPHVFSVIPEEFPNLHHMEKLSFQILAEWDSSKLGEDGILIYLFLHQVEKSLANGLFNS